VSGFYAARSSYLLYGERMIKKHLVKRFASSCGISGFRYNQKRFSDCTIMFVHMRPFSTNSAFVTVLMLYRLL